MINSQAKRYYSTLHSKTICKYDCHSQWDCGLVEICRIWASFMREDYCTLLKSSTLVDLRQNNAQFMHPLCLCTIVTASIPFTLVRAQAEEAT